MDDLMQYLRLLFTVILIQLVLIGAALLDLSKRAATKGPKWLWIVIILFVNTIGPIAYFVIGREDE